MSRQSTSYVLIRSLLLFHLLAVAVSVVLLLPTIAQGFAARRILLAGANVAFVVLAIVIGMSSARLGAGMALGLRDWTTHAIWNILLLSSCFLRWGPFQFRAQPSSGDLQAFSRFNTLYPLLMVTWAVVLVGIYSGIPIGLSFLGPWRVRPISAGRVRMLIVVSIISFGLTIFLSLLLRLWHGNEERIGVAVAVSLVISFCAASFSAAQGDRISARILFCEAAVFGLLLVT